MPEVREHFVEGSIDVVERYEVDGLHFEFMRAVPFFEKDEPKKTEHMNAYLRTLRGELDRVGQKRSKRILLSLMLPTPYHHRILRSGWPAEFVGMAEWGLDPATWIKEGWVDILMPCIYAADLNMPKPADRPPWVTMAGNSSTKVYACVMNIGGGNIQSPEQARRTVQVLRDLSSQYDGIFLFNGQPYDLADVLGQAAEGVNLNQEELLVDR